MTVSLTYVVSEVPDTLPATGYSIVLSRSDGFQLHKAWGATRALAIQGLKDYGFTVTDE